MPHNHRTETGRRALKIRFEAFAAKHYTRSEAAAPVVDGNGKHETAMLDYFRYLLAPDNRHFAGFFIVPCNPSSAQGLVNSLSAGHYIKLTAPGAHDGILSGEQAIARYNALHGHDGRREPVLTRWRERS